MNKVERIKNILDKANEDYYNNNKSDITDLEYDNFLNEYEELTGVDKTVLGDASLNNKVTHTYPITSLGKIHTEEELRAAIAKLAPVVIEPKIDGLTIVIYPKGIIASRGNGVVGENITKTASKINKMGLVHNTYPIRAEAYISDSDFILINKERESNGLEAFDNKRNAAAGMLRNLDASKVKNMSYLAYNLVGSKQSNTEQLKELKEIGIPVITYKEFSKDEIDEAVKYVLSFKDIDFGYDIDGVVIKSNRENSLDIFGQTKHHPNDAVAFKFEAKKEWTKLIDVEWNTGKTGTVTPVAIFEPIRIDGSTISRATLHNYGIFSSHCLCKGCDILIAKSNEVIPVVLKAENRDINKKIKEPSVCPNCGHTLSIRNGQLFCDNPDCSAKTINKIIYIASKKCLDIVGLSEATVSKLENMDDYLGIFNLTKEDILKLPGFADKSAENLYNAIQSKKTIPLSKFIQVACIDGIGESLSEVMAKKFRTLDNFINALDSKHNFTEIDGMGDILLERLFNNKDIFNRLQKVFKVIDEKAAYNQSYNFVITGTLSNPRSYYERIIKENGSNVLSSVSKKVDYLVAGEKAGSKLDKANKLNIKVITEKELFDILGGE